MAQAASTARIDPARTLTTAFLNAGKALGLSRGDLGRVIGKDRSTLTRGHIDPDSKSGELALLLVRCYRALFVLVGGEPDQMRHWMHTPNRHTGGVPAEQVCTVQGLIRVTEYLDAMRGKV
ncbi:XRE family transcriptional regulator [Thioalkalivibrio denitrificans]|uniref:XRE family transcriptional regulator n=1 Tax=Thioalkalivibrio denitrificans TaxID=108003 RepID=A0A1V3N7R8_9GAMM|nr:MbcA/ParS/Xre antitoxin family protein [Thioalkalivibrio denitrificans]OOG21013.1 XRE family transcriptional regulator [Thioalkalivibrio denitrificans]